MILTKSSRTGKIVGLGQRIGYNKTNSGIRIRSGKGKGMSSKTEDRIKALEIALNNESRERDFYLNHSKRTKNDLGKKMFASIAGDEEEHYQRILGLHKKLKAEGKWPETVPIQVKGTEVKAVIQKVADAAAASSAADKDDLEAVKTAIDFETKGEAFYGKLAKEVENPVEKIRPVLKLLEELDIPFTWAIVGAILMDPDGDVMARLERDLGKGPRSASDILEATRSRAVDSAWVSPEIFWLTRPQDGRLESSHLFPQTQGDYSPVPQEFYPFPRGLLQSPIPCCPRIWK